MRISLKNDIAYKFLYLINLPIILAAFKHRIVFYSFLLLAPLFPMPIYFSLFGVVPPSAVMVALMVVLLIFNLPVDTRLNNIFMDLNNIGNILMLFSIILAVDIYWVFLGNSNKEILYFAGRLVFVCTVLLTYIYVDSEIELIKCFRIILYGIMILALSGVIQSIFEFGFVRPPRRFGVVMPFAKSIGIPMSAGEFGIIMTLGLPLVVSEMLGKCKVIGSRLVATISVGVILFAIFILQSRSTWLAALLTLMTYCILTQKNKHFKVLFLSSFIMIFLILFIDQVAILYNALLGEGIFYRNVTSRLESNLFALNAILNSIMFGYGNASFYQMYEIFSGVGIGLHNNFISQFFSTGLFGFVPYISVYCYLLWNLLSGINKKQFGIYYSCMIASLVGSVIELNFYQGYFSEVLAIEIGLILVLTKKTYIIH